MRVSGVLEDMIRENIRMDVDNLTCTGGRRLTVTPEELEKMDEDAMFLAYADGLLGLGHVPRMRARLFSE